MINLKENMKYLVNFQIELNVKDGSKKKFRSTHTILESEIDKSLVDNFDKIKIWFIDYFYNNSIDNFIDVPEINKEYTVNIKVGRITNSVDGKYKTF